MYILKKKWRYTACYTHLIHELICLLNKLAKKKNEMDEENKHTRENFKIEEWFMIIKISSINHYKGH